MLVARANLTANDITPLEFGSGSVEVVKELKYLGSLIEACGGALEEVICKFPQGSKFFDHLCSSVFLAWDLSLETKRLVYQSVVLGVLLHGAESWAPKLFRSYRFSTVAVLDPLWE